MKTEDIKAGHWYLTADRPHTRLILRIETLLEPPHNGGVWLVFVFAISDRAKYTAVKTSEYDVFDISMEDRPAWLSVSSLAKCLSNDITELFYSPLPPHPFFEKDMLDYIKI